MHAVLIHPSVTKLKAQLIHCECKFSRLSMIAVYFVRQMVFFFSRSFNSPRPLGWPKVDRSNSSLWAIRKFVEPCQRNGQRDQRQDGWTWAGRGAGFHGIKTVAYITDVHGDLRRPLPELPPGNPPTNPGSCRPGPRPRPRPTRRPEIPKILATMRPPPVPATYFLPGRQREPEKT